MASHPTPPALSLSLFRPGMRVAVAVSGGADSVALLRSLLAARAALGIVLSVAHVHHGIRGADADADADFVSGLAAHCDLPLHLRHVDTPAVAHEHRETLEEAARNLRYGWFRSLLEVRETEAIATAHTLDDQAETVLMKMLRGAWTEGLGGIHPIVEAPPGRILRPLLGVRRAEIEAYLRDLGQPWREDASNLDPAHTRNRLRHQLLPLLAEYNPQIHTQLAHLATIARDEEAYWQSELARLLPSLLLPGKPVRGGGRSISPLPGENSVSLEIERLRALAPATRRRVLRAAAQNLDCSIDFDQTERLLALGGLGADIRTPAPRHLDLASGLVAERNHRELRFSRKRPSPEEGAALVPVLLPVPGEISASAYGLHLSASLALPREARPDAILRTWKPGDRVQIRHSRGYRKVKEVLQRMLASDLPLPGLCGLSHPSRACWPVVEWQNEIIWMLGADVLSPVATASGLTIVARALPVSNSAPKMNPGTKKANFS
jgi:tRNA(Ile)-lysidine synthase